MKTSDEKLQFHYFPTLLFCNKQNEDERTNEQSKNGDAEKAEGEDEDENEGEDGINFVDEVT